jgi:hypothetical protein
MTLAVYTSTWRVSSDTPAVCPFLAHSVQQGPASGGKARHKAKVKNRTILPTETSNPAKRCKGPQSAANDVFSAC